MTGSVSTFIKNGEIMTPEALSSQKTAKTSKNQRFYSSQMTRNGATFGGHSFRAFYTIFVSQRPRSLALCNATDPGSIQGRNAALQGLQWPVSAGFGSLKLP